MMSFGNSHDVNSVTMKNVMTVAWENPHHLSKSYD